MVFFPSYFENIFSLYGQMQQPHYIIVGLVVGLFDMLYNMSNIYTKWFVVIFFFKLKKLQCLQICVVGTI